MWAMRSFINPSIMFPARFAATALGWFFFYSRPASQHPRALAHIRIHAHTSMVIPFRGVTRRWRQYSFAQFPILEKTLFKRPRYFFVIPLRTAWSGEGVAQLVSRRARSISIWSCVWSMNLMVPIVPSGLFMPERVPSNANARCQSYNTVFLKKKKNSRNTFSSTLQTGE